MQKGDDGHTLNLMFGMEQNMWRQQNCKLKCHVKKLQADEMAKTFRQRVAQAEAAAKAEELRLHQESGFALRADLAASANELGLEELHLAEVPSAIGEDWEDWFLHATVKCLVFMYACVQMCAFLATDWVLSWGE